MLFRPNPSSGVPIYLQLMEQVKHGVETGLLKPGDQLPALRRAAEELVINPNTVAKAYRELERQGVVELRQGAGVFVAAAPTGGAQTDRLRAGSALAAEAVAQLRAAGLSEDEIRRLFDAALTRSASLHAGDDHD
jgi:GntR family transcriptional regulator